MFILQSRGMGFFWLGFCLFFILLAGPLQAAPFWEPKPPPAPVAPPPPKAPEWVRSELIFSLQNKDGDEVTQDEWDLFVQEVVIPRFADGLTMLEGFGRAKGRTGEARELMNVLVLVYLDTDKNTDAVDEIASQYKKRFQLPVISVKTPAKVKFY